nr:two-component system response regulator CreB [Ostreibacterium oceani]
MITTVLIIEDEAEIADTLLYALTAEGMHPTWVMDAKSALVHLASTPTEFIILDVGLPDASGFELFKTIRQQYDIPTMFLTARSEEIDRIVGLEIGADDYVTKPFSPREVVARVRNILKRSQTMDNAPELSTQAVSQAMAASDEGSKNTPFLLDEQLMKIAYRGHDLALTRSEYLLLSTLIKYPKRIYSRRQLIEQVWTSNHPSDDRVIDTHIKSLRQKLKSIDADDIPIVTHRGFGYSLAS